MAVKTPAPRILQSQRASFLYLEFCRVHMDGDRLVYAISEGAVTRQWNIPTANTAALLLGSGCSITQAAARKLASERVLVSFTGRGGTPIFLGSISEYVPTESLTQWIKFWPDPEARLEAAKYLAFARCDSVEKIWHTHSSKPASDLAVPLFKGRIPSASSIEQLRGFEGDFAKAAYREVARATRLDWKGRQAGEDDQDLANAFLDQGNYLAYGAAGVVLWALGIPPGLAVNHGVTRAGGLVFDLADAIKDAIVLPIAFESAASGSSSQAFRDAVIDAFDELEVLPNLFAILKETIRQGMQGIQ